MISVTINGKSLEVRENLTVLQAAEHAGIIIPTLCYHKDLTPFGGCRMCVVEIQGSRLPATSCTMPVTRGMIVQTETPKLIRYRRFILESLLSKYYDAGYTRSNGRAGLSLDTQFAHWANFYGIDVQSSMSKTPFYKVDSDPNPFIWVDMNKCIQCTRCIRACAEIQGRFVWGLAYRGYTSRILPGSDKTMLQSRCESCGACVAYCPTGALDNKMSVSLGHPDKLITTTCAYCGVGCQLDLNVKEDVPGGRVFRVTSNPKAPINGMHLCVKGRYGYDFIHSPKRLEKPRLRKYLIDGTPRPSRRGPWVEVDWDTALNVTANMLREAVGRYGPEKIGLLASGKLLNEENYLASKLARQVIGTNNIDVCAHLYHFSIVDGLDNSLGIWAQTNSMDDVTDYARAMLIIGSNTTEEHPVFGAKIRQAVLRRECKLVVAHPDFINMSEYAALRLVHQLGSDSTLINGLIHIILEKGWENHAFVESHSEGFAEFKKAVEQYKPDVVSRITGVPIETLFHAVEILAHNRPMAVIWGVDLARHKSCRSTVISLANLQLLLGNLGFPGGGLIPLRAQNNLQGACDMGVIPNMYPGYQPVEDTKIRRKFEVAWGTELPMREGMAAREMIDAAEKGDLKALYILGEDVVSGAPNSQHVRRSLQNCELVILQEYLPSETSFYADIILPGTSFAEKTGTFTNTERRIQMVHEAIDLQCGSSPDWSIIKELAWRIKPDIITASHRFSGWDYEDTSQIMAEIAALTPPYGGVSHARLELVSRLQWPVDTIDHPGTPILLNEHFKSARFIPIQPDVAGEPAL
jgi:predicted molibdopterin-dependent oxidoreductase YjgC